LEEVYDYGNRVIMSYHLLLVCKRLTPLVNSELFVVNPAGQQVDMGIVA